MGDQAMDRASPDAANEPEKGASTPAVGRRSFVRALAGDAVGAAGRIAAISGAMHGSMLAAGRALTEGIEELGPEGVTAARPGPSTPSAAAAPAAGSGGFGPTPHPPTEPKPALVLEADVREALVRARTAVMAANEPGCAPQLSVSPVAFDGEVFQLPGRSMTARIANLQRDARATLAVLDGDSGDWYVITGVVELLHGDAARDACDVLLASGATAHLPGAPAASGNLPVLIVLRPERVLRRPAERLR
jgi:hypothetical protein